MALVAPRTTVAFSTTLTLSEVESRALDALAGYSTDEFLKVFYEKMGRAYLQPHEAGLRALFETIRTQIPGELSRIDAMRRSIKERP